MLFSLALLSYCLNPAAAEPLVYGAVERVTILPESLTLEARIDTGAQTASLSAVDIELFEKGKETWVNFNVPIDRGPPVSFTRKVEGTSKIKGRLEEADTDQTSVSFIERPLVHLDLCIGDQTRTIEFNLTNRQNLNYPVLIGRKALLKFQALVDVSTEFTRKLACAKNARDDKKNDDAQS